MARRVVLAGHHVTVFDSEFDRIEELVEFGACGADSIQAACARNEVVVTSLPDDAALDAVARGNGGIRDTLPAGAIHLLTGTHGVPSIRAIEAAHVEARQILVAAPLFGRPDLAATGRLRIVVGGSVRDIARCAPILDAIGEKTYVAGSRPEAALLVKLANNLMLGCAVQAMAEAFSLLSKHGIPPSVLYDVATEGFFSAPVYQIYGRTMIDESYDEVGFTAKLGLKDMNLVLAAAEAAGVPLPSTTAYRDRLLEAVVRGNGERDLAVVAREQARASGLL